MSNVRLEGNLTVKTPNGSEQWCMGETYTLAWETGSAGTYVKTELYDGSARVRTIAERVNNSGSYAWTVPDSLPESSTYKIRISDYSDAGVYDESNGYFSVVKSCELKVVSPNGGEKWYMGDVHAVEWDTGVSSDDVRIYLFKEKEQMMMRIVSEADNTGSYSWTVPDTLSEGNDYKIYVKSYFDESVSDQSDGYFSIVPRESPDQPPDADAGADKEDVTEGDRVTLNGSGYDSDGWVVSYLWEQTGGPAVEINPSDAGTVNLMFIAPDVGASGATLTFRLTVTDNDGLTDADTCLVKVKDGGSSTFTNSLGMTFNLISAGTFMMGSSEDELGRESDETLHQVTLMQDFYMQITEVTQGQWKAVMGSNPSYFQNCGDGCPVETVSWNDIQEFITEMNQRGEGIYRLPTEAEWEYSARAGSNTAFSNGGITETGCGYDSNLDAIGWYCNKSCVTYAGGYDCSGWGGSCSSCGTNQVGRKQANSWGLYDMSGNVWEWCQDWYGDYPASAVTDPVGPSTGSDRVFRGGSWGGNARSCRSAGRNRSSPADRGDYLGFRLVFSPGQ
ncbi:MAG: SUMF1/EgtB/PvdO family nonheme iron enzyme [Desulfobacteraceae bacterium]|nr:SUMF1/EgtB/PvdO family nonheme iron enzyme [Desulfobacteraceae bacterium]